jgi:hypothetical protein
MTRDWQTTKIRYLQFDEPHQLGHLASNLSRLSSVCSQPLPAEMALAAMDESRHYLEWMTPHSSESLGIQLIELQNLLASWQLHWSVLWTNPQSRLEIAQVAQKWSERLLNHSGLLAG